MPSRDIVGTGAPTEHHQTSPKTAKTTGNHTPPGPPPPPPCQEPNTPRLTRCGHGAGAGDLTLGRPNDVPSGTTQVIDAPIMQNPRDTVNPHVTRQAQNGKNLPARQVLAGFARGRAIGDTRVPGREPSLP